MVKLAYCGSGVFVCFGLIDRFKLHWRGGNVALRAEGVTTLAKVTQTRTDAAMHRCACTRTTVVWSGCIASAEMVSVCSV